MNRYKHTLRVGCLNCETKFKPISWEEKDDERIFGQGDTGGWIAVLQCPKCDENWEDSCGVDLAVYPKVKEVLTKEKE